MASMGLMEVVELSHQGNVGSKSWTPNGQGRTGHYGGAAKERRFWALLAYSFLVIIPIYVLLIHGVKLLVDRGLSRMDAAFMIALAGIASSVFKIFWGWPSDRAGREITFTIGAVAMALGVLFLLFVEAGAPLWLTYLFVLFFGCGWGVTSTTFMSVAADLFAGRSFGLIYGINEAVIGMGSALGPWLGGFVFDQTGRAIGSHSSLPLAPPSLPALSSGLQHRERSGESRDKR
ncbi:MAG: hypothetical protein C0392_07585 [Syntrophus sp. (in: bacteria)]|nr:hypothetical protein [Syntrophus sp. (in: bacteria)]